MIKKFISESLVQEFIFDHFRNVKPSQVHFGRHQVCQGAYPTTERNDNVIIRSMVKTPVVYDTALKQYVHKEFFLLKTFEEANICPKIILYMDSPDFCHVVTEKFSSDWSVLTSFVKNCTADTRSKEVVRNIIMRVLEMNSLGLHYVDIQPENIMIHRETLEVRFVDFRNAIYEKTDSDIMARIKACTLQYSAPELISEVSHSVSKSQVYSIGCVLCFLVEKEHPYRDLCQTDWAEFRKSSDIEQCLIHVLELCTKSTAALRPDLADILKMEWFAKEE